MAYDKMKKIVQRLLDGDLERVLAMSLNCTNPRPIRSSKRPGVATRG